MTYFLLAAIGLIVAFSALFIYASNESGRQQEFSGDIVAVVDGEEQEKAAGMKLYVTASTPEGKSWIDILNHTDMPHGREFDFEVVNDSGRILKDWTIDLVFSDDVMIDSSWNGEYKANGPAVHFVPDKDTDFMTYDEQATFGAIIYSGTDLSAERFTIRGKLPIDVTNTVLYNVLLVLFIIWISCLAAYIISYARVDRFKRQRERDLQIIDQSITTFTNFIDAKDPYTKGHSVRVAIYSRELARRYGFSEDDLQDVYYDALLHDAGKIGIPDAILTKPGKLTGEEYETIKKHTTIGNEILTKFTAIKDVRDGAHYHHERFDGKGYPEGIKGQAIPLVARIICVCDSYDAMSSHRSYRRSYDKEKILSELKENSGTQFDPDLVPVMIGMINDGFTEMIRTEYGAEAEMFADDKDKLSKEKGEM